jgi:epsilon-lactone hydrolase
MGSYAISQGVVDLGKVRLPIPASISAEAQACLARTPFADQESPQPMWAMRDALVAMSGQLNAEAQSAYPVAIEEACIGGVRCHIITPTDRPLREHRVLINLHAGGFVIGSGWLVEAIPISCLTGIAVISVDYRLAPEHPFPAAIDDILAVYRALAREYDPSRIGIFGTSAGGFLTAMSVMRFKREGLPLPACCGIFTAGGDVTQLGDSFNLFTPAGFHGHIGFPLDDPMCERTAFIGNARHDDPLLAPIRGDLSDFPPTLLVTGTRDSILSASVLFHRALRRAGRDADLHLFEGMPHAFWFTLDLPESREAYAIMAHFMENRLEDGPA